MTGIKKTPIPQRLKNVSADHPYVAGAVDIFDDDLDAKQSDINHDQDVSNQGFRRDIDKNADDIAALNVEVQSEQMVIGATVFDAWPTLNSNHPVTSDGIYRKDIQAEVVVGDPTGDWNPTTAEAAYERCQGDINVLTAVVNASQLEIGAVQTDLVPTSSSANMLPSGAIYNSCVIIGDLVSTVAD